MSTVEPRGYEGNAWVKLGDARVGLWQMNGSLARSIRWLLPTEYMEGMPPLLVLDRYSLIHRSPEEQEEALLKLWPMSQAVTENFPASLPIQYLHRRALLNKAELPSLEEEKKLEPLETLWSTVADWANPELRILLEGKVEELKKLRLSRRRYDQLIDCYEALGSRVTVQRVSSAIGFNYWEVSAVLEQLRWAVRFNNLELARSLVQLPLTKGQLNCRLIREPTPLEIAIEGRQIPMIQLLAEAGIDLDAKEANVYRPLEQAINDGHDDVAQTLLDYGANPNALTNKRQWVQPLLDAGADPFHKSTFSIPLYTAADYDLQETCQKLLNLGADPCEEVGIDRSPLHVAILRGRLSSLKLMLETRKLDANWRPHPEGLTLLEFARSVGQREVIDYLEGKEEAGCQQ